MTRLPFVAVIAILLALLLSACSGSSQTTAPDLTATAWDSHITESQSHTLLGVWEVRIDFDGVTITDVTRAVNNEPPHYNVKVFLKPPKCGDCIEISNISDDPVNQILSADVTIKNPTGLSAADIRAIVMSTNPEIYLANPDDYTKIHDPKDPQEINPFRLYNKEITNGIMFPLGDATETFQIHYDSLPAIFMTAVDAIFPVTAPREPYSIQNQTIAGNLDLEGEHPRRVEVDVFDRQNNVGEVRISSDALDVDMELTPDPDNDNHYYAMLSNTEMKPAGDYDLLITATDAVLAWELYDYLTVTVSESLGEWVVDTISFPDYGCPRDICIGWGMMSGLAHFYYSSGMACHDINRSLIDLTDEIQYFNLENIDLKVPGLSPFPARRLDTTFFGGIMFISDSDDIYQDDFYTGPMKSLVFSIYDVSGLGPEYTNPGDGDASRMYPSVSTYIAVDITGDVIGNMYGLWADAEGTGPPEIYGLSADFTRHDVFMGGYLPPELVGSGEGLISPDSDNLITFLVSSLGMESGLMYILEYDGAVSEIEVIQYDIDFFTKTTSFTHLSTVDLGSIVPVDMDILLINPTYKLNPEGESIAILVDGSSGGYVRLLSTVDFSFVEDLGSDTEPAIPGTPAHIDGGMEPWMLVMTNQEDSVVTYEWIL